MNLEHDTLLEVLEKILYPHDYDDTLDDSIEAMIEGDY